MCATCCSHFAEADLLSQASLLDWVRNELVGEVTAVAANNQLYAQRRVERTPRKQRVCFQCSAFPHAHGFCFTPTPRGPQMATGRCSGSRSRHRHQPIRSGAETVKDGIVHTAVGVAHYRRIGNRNQEEPNPLGADTPIGRCSHCQAVSLSATPGTTVCPVCQTPNFAIVSVTQPRGFRTLFDGGRDFDGTFEWTPRASRRKTDADMLPMGTVANVEFWSGEHDVCTVNDNAGQLFQFESLANSESWVTRDAVDYARQQSGAPEPQYDSATAPRLVGLGSIKRTDFSFWAFTMCGLNSISRRCASKAVRRFILSVSFSAAPFLSFSTSTNRNSELASESSATVKGG